MISSRFCRHHFSSQEPFYISSNFTHAATPCGDYHWNKKVALKSAISVSDKTGSEEDKLPTLCSLTASQFCRGDKSLSKVSIKPDREEGIGLISIPLSVREAFCASCALI